MSLFEAYPSSLEEITYRGYRFKYPFRCMCCNIQISFRQFCFGRNCGYCDTGACQRAKSHDRPHGVTRFWEVMPDGSVVPTMNYWYANLEKAKMVNKYH